MKFKLKLVAYALALSFAGGVLAGCGGGDSSSPPPPPPPPPPVNHSFTAFVKETLMLEANSQPRKVNGVDFTFPDLKDPKAYCDILPPTTTGPCADGG